MAGGEIVVVAGPPGAGKSTVSRALAERLDLAVLVQADDLMDAVVQGWIPPWEPESYAQNRTVLAATAAAVREFAIGGYTVIVDGVIGPWHLDVFASGVEQNFHYVVLRPDKATTVARATSRGSEALTDLGPITQMCEQFAQLGDFDRFAIDTSDLDIAATVDAVVALVAERHHLTNSRVLRTPD